MTEANTGAALEAIAASPAAHSPLFEPMTLRSMTMRNRIAMSPMTREFSTNGVPGPDVAEYYRRRAAGGVGLIVTEGTGVDHPVAVDGLSIPVLHGAEALAGWRRVTDAVHAEGAVIVPQLWHQGPLRDARRSRLREHPGLRPSGYWGTPGVTSYDDEYVHRMQVETSPMTDQDVQDVIEGYVTSARNAVASGFDGIAIHGAHGYLIDSYFWPDTNRRDDRFGGDPAARAAFGAAVVSAIRAEIGEDLPIIFRLSQHKQQDYKARFAETPDELGVILGALADAGVDLFDASSRRFNQPAFEGSDLTLSAWARKLTGRPSMAVGGIGLNNWLQDTLKNRGQTQTVNNLDEVLGLFERGMFDMIAVGRALISDPNWVQKARLREPFLPYDRSSLDRLE